MCEDSGKKKASSAAKKICHDTKEMTKFMSRLAGVRRRRREFVLWGPEGILILKDDDFSAPLDWPANLFLRSSSSAALCVFAFLGIAARAGLQLAVRHFVVSIGHRFMLAFDGRLRH